MIPGSAVGAIHRLAWITDEAEAEATVQEAIQRGASVDDALDALALWRRMRAASVTRVYTGGAA